MQIAEQGRLEGELLPLRKKVATQASALTTAKEELEKSGMRNGKLESLCRTLQVGPAISAEKHKLQYILDVFGALDALGNLDMMHDLAVHGQSCPPGRDAYIKEMGAATAGPDRADGRIALFHRASEAVARERVYGMC